MFEIVNKISLNENTDSIDVYAPHIAKKAKPGQFIILRIDEKGERIPLTISRYNAEAGTVGLIYQKIGRTTMRLGMMKRGDSILDFVGPLGTPSELDGYGKVAVIGGGLGCAIAYPQAEYLHKNKAKVTVIAGFRNRELIILENELRAVCDKLTVMTDDGSNGNFGLVTDALKAEIESGAEFDAVIVIGPPMMMKFVSQLTRQYNIKTIVSMNPIMIDGTGMCGGCRVTVDGKIKFACIDGPDFDGHKVDYDELIKRNRTYANAEHDELCNLLNMKPM